MHWLKKDGFFPPLPIGDLTTPRAGGEPHEPAVDEMRWAPLHVIWPITIRFPNRESHLPLGMWALFNLF